MNSRMSGCQHLSVCILAARRVFATNRWVPKIDGWPIGVIAKLCSLQGRLSSGSSSSYLDVIDVHDAQGPDAEDLVVPRLHPEVFFEIRI